VKKVFLILLISLCTFCTAKKDQKPEGLYSAEQIAVFLKDLYMLEQKVRDIKISDDSAQVIFDIYEKKLFEKHNLDDSIYRASFVYYMDDIEELGKIYEIIADSLSLEERLFTSKEYPDEDY